MTVQEAYKQLMYRLFELYQDREAGNIAGIVIEHITGFRKIDRIVHKNLPLNAAQQALLTDYTNQLLQYKPLQYVLHEAWFAGMQLYVDEHVLIPRPETEELVEWIVNETQHSKLEISNILDIGTGSGCIPIALKKKIPFAEVHALDFSGAALEVAQKNAVAHGAFIRLHTVDILSKQDWEHLPVFDLIVSNPPYIKQSEKNSMHSNVIAFEPHAALFVPDDDALFFYKAIILFASVHLHRGGLLFFEINEALGEEMCLLLKNAGYTAVELKKDLQGKDRMVKACRV